jgi:hypothetical protein
MQNVKKKSSVLAVILGLVTGIFVALYFGWRSFVVVLLTVIIVVALNTFYFNFNMPGWLPLNMLFFGVWGYFLSKYYNENYDTYRDNGPLLLCRMYVLLNIVAMFLISIINDLREGYYGLAALDFFIFMPLAALIFTKAVSFIVTYVFSVGESNKSEAVPAKIEERIQYYDKILEELNDILSNANEYNIDYENGTIPIGDLPIGARVVDPGWEWEFRTGYGYTREEGDQTKPVTWIIVAKDHYESLGPHVTLLSEELIGEQFFDNSSHVNSSGYNHWGESGTHSSATHGLRPWLNSTGIHEGEGFYQAFSESFKSALLYTTLSSKEWEKGIAYSTEDYVFLPSTTELGDTAHDFTYPIGSVYSYFNGEDDSKRAALLGGYGFWYWTRSPDSVDSDGVRGVYNSGAFDNLRANASDFADDGVRPALNLKADTLVSKIKN